MTTRQWNFKPRHDCLKKSIAIENHKEAWERSDLPQDMSWQPKNIKLYNQQINVYPYEKNTFQAIPWSILCNKKFGKSLEARGLLAILARSADENGRTKLTNKEIEKRRGPRPVRGKKVKWRKNQDTPTRLLSLLEESEAICIHNREGKNRTIHICQDAIDIIQKTKNCPQEEKQLFIPPEIFLLTLSTPQKIYTAARMALQGLSVKNMSKRLGISENTIKDHHFILENTKGVLEKLVGEDFEFYIKKLPVELQPPIKPYATPDKTLYRYILGIDIDYNLLLLHNNRNNLNEHSVRGQGVFQNTPSLQNQNNQNLPYKENQLNPSLKENNNMAKVPYDDTPEEHARWEAYRQNKIKTVGTASKSAHCEFKPKRKIRQFKPTNDGRYDARYLADIDWIKKECPFINTSKPGTWIYDNALWTVRALAIGPTNGLRPDEITAILSVMVGKKPGQLNYPLSKEYIARNFLSIKFSESDRHELYTRLNNMQSAEFKGKGKKVELDWAMRTNNNYSWLVHLWFAPPKRPREEFPPDLNDYKGQYERALGLMPVNLAKDQEGRLAWTVRVLKKVYLEEFRARRPVGYEGDLFYGDWPKFFNSLAEHFENQDVNIYPGWFRSDSEPIKGFLAESGFRDARAGCRLPAYNKEQEGSHAQW